MKNMIQAGTSSAAFRFPVYIQSAASIAGKKEGEGPLKDSFDRIIDDPLLGKDSWESAESMLQKKASALAVKKAGLDTKDIRLAFAGDLLAQTTASSFGTAGMGIPFYGLYAACSTMGEALSLGAMAVSAGFGDHILCATSSHFASAEKEFRYPLGYGNQRPLSATWTVTGSGACIIGSDPPETENSPDSLRSGNRCAAITGITAGRIIDFGFRDSLNMGACMAPAACDTILRNLSDFGRTPSDYDAIVTGDLGIVGCNILLDMLRKNGTDIGDIHQDCGLMIYDNSTQDTHSGGSGCGCSAVVLAAHLLPGIIGGQWKRMLFIPTGAMLSKVTYNEGASVPGIAHAVVIELMEI